MEYGFAFGYAVSHDEVPLPAVRRFTPLFELAGETELNKNDAGHNSLLGTVGLRLDLKPIGGVESGLGLGFVFPIDNGARAEVHWGIVTSLVFEF